jgi:hypothetical protein
MIGFVPAGGLLDVEVTQQVTHPLWNCLTKSLFMELPYRFLTSSIVLLQLRWLPSA